MKGTWSSTSAILLFVIFILCNIHHDFLFVGATGKTVRLQLVHKYSPHLHARLGLSNKTDIEIFRELYHRDKMRHQTSFHNGDVHLRRHPRRKVAETSSSSSISMPLHSGFDLRSGLYFVDVTIGTPPRTFLLVADTGSDLTWINCKYNKTSNQTLLKKEHLHETHNKSSHFLNRRVFQADQSSTFKPLPCSHGMCHLGLAHMNTYDNCPTPSSPCRYNYTYLGGNVVEGFIGYDIVRAPLTNGTKANLPNITIGCTESTFKPLEGDGLLGLGFGDYSFTETITAYKVATKFSYCLVNHRSNSNVFSYLAFGANNQSVNSTMRYTDLFMTGLMENAYNFYGVDVVGISLGGTLLNIPSQVWDPKRGGGRVILDSGATMTWLALPAYKAVMDELKKALSKHKSIIEKGIPFEFCFNATGFQESSVPRLAFHFADGGRFEPPVQNYVLNAYATDDTVKCLGFVPAQGKQSIIGNQMQQNYLWEFDIVGGKVGFAPSSCT